MTDVQAPARTFVLTNSDLLYCVFTFVFAPLPGSLSEWDNPRGHLAQSATVCRGFHEPVIRLLCKLPSFFPLWHLLAPPNAKWPSRYKSETNTAQLLLIQAVLLQNGRKPFIPLLHSIRWQARAPTDSSLISFFTSTLRNTTLSLASRPGEEETRALLFHRLYESSPYLEKIEINDLAVEAGLVQELLSFDRLRDLRVHCGLSGPATFLNLISMPNLTSLSIRDISGPLGTLSSPTLVHNLLELYIKGTGPVLVGHFNLVRLEALESMTVNIECYLDAEREVEDVLRALYDALSSSGTLRSLTVHIHDRGRARRPGSAISLRNLLRPTVDIAMLAGAWPKLERLALNASPPSESDEFSLHALHFIHAHCPHLQELETENILLPVLGVHAIPAPLNRSPPHRLRRLPEYRPGHIVDEHAEALDTEAYGQWCPTPGVLQTSAPPQRLDGRKVLVHVYNIAQSERGRR
ncbi:hypothetical protein V8D89_007570 [Ganoderma adspersum]